MIRVSCVIPVDGRSDYLRRSLETLLRQSALERGLTAEILVVDNSRSPDRQNETFKVCREAHRPGAKRTVQLRYIAARHPNPTHHNASYPLNVGIRLARGSVILISAADILHVTETLEQHLDHHRYGTEVMVFSFCRDCPASTPLEPSILHAAIQDRRFRLRMASHTDWFGGMCCSAKRRHLVEVGGFEETFSSWGYEDYDLARRLLLRGLSVIRDDGIQVLHQMHPTSGGTAWSMKLYAGLRQLLRTRDANRHRPWGETKSDPVVIDESLLEAS